MGFQAAVAMARSGKEAEQAGNRMMQEIEEEEGESPDFEDLGPPLHNMTRHKEDVIHYEGGGQGGDIYIIINQDIP